MHNQLLEEIMSKNRRGRDPRKRQQILSLSIRRLGKFIVMMGRSFEHLGEQMAKFGDGVEECCAEYPDAKLRDAA